MLETLVQHLTERSVAVSRSVARLLSRCESFLKPAQGGSVDPGRITAEKLLELATRDPAYDRAWLLDGIKLAGNDHPFLERLARLVLHAWSQEFPHSSLRRRYARRPDVLSLTCRLLANPEVPYTYEVARFCVVLTLRSLYNITYDLDSIKQIRASYEALRVRFEEQERRRQLKRPNSPINIENYLLDLLCLDQWIRRALRPIENLKAYYQGFEDYPLGVDRDRKRRPFATPGSSEWPELYGSLPDFGRVLNLSFAQPTAIRGFDDVTGGLVAAVPEAGDHGGGSLVTLITGPPGSGKTSLCLSLTSRMAQLGSTVRYITTEERVSSLYVKRTALAGTTTASLWPDYALSPMEDERFRIVTGSDFDNLSKIITQLQNELSRYQNQAPEHGGEPNKVDLFLVFPTVIVIDSLTTLLQGEPNELTEGSDPEDFTASRRKQVSRKQVSNVLNKLRSLGVCTFLVGGLEDCTSHGLHYLVDNAFTLDIEGSDTRNHQYGF